MGSRGRLHWNTKEVRKIRSELKLSEFQKAVLIGAILGDGCLVENFWKKHYRLQIEQGNNHKEYVFWLYSVFKNWTLSQPKYLRKRRSWRFFTISHPEITRFRKIFYKNRKKIIPDNIKELLAHPISLAVWFMDDGGLHVRKKTVTLSTHNFSRRNNQRLIKCLNENFKLQTNLNWDGKGFRLYVPLKSIQNFRNLISSLIVPIMRYKLPLTP